VRRHPDIPWLKSETDLGKLAALQSRLLDHAVTLVKPGGALVYCTCSLEREEGEDRIAALLARNPALCRSPIDADEVGGQAEFLTTDGALRTLPCHWPDTAEPRMAGLDGFYAARIARPEST
jgi:16S rRNA (cytosine967-C5)-methyltransferase